MMDRTVLPAPANPVIINRHVDKECFYMTSKSVGFLLSVSIFIWGFGFE